MDVKRLIKGTKEYNDALERAKEWWNVWKFHPPEDRFLPTNMICAYNEEGPACVGFLYSTDSQISWLEWIVVRPDQSKENRNFAIEMVISTSKVLASALGFGCVFASTKNSGLKNRLGKKFTQTDDDMTHYTWRC